MFATLALAFATVAVQAGASPAAAQTGAPGAARSDDPPRALAIVAPAAWVALLEPLRAARQRERPTELVALEDLLAAESQGDAPERLKRWLHRAWKERRLGYALLVGDADVLPVRFMVLDRREPKAFDYAFYPSDLYYADLADERGEFDSWNAEHEGIHARYFGEVRGEKNKEGPINFDRVSYVPEIAVGRWPVSDAKTLQQMVAKTLAWRPTGPAPRVVAVHPAGWVDQRPRAAAMVERLAAAGFATSRRFFGDAAGAPDRAFLAAEVAKGADFVFHLGHGSPTTWEHCLGAAEIEASRAAHPALWFSVGCNTAEFCCEPPYGAYLDEGGILHRGTWNGELFQAPPPPPAALQPGPLNTTGVGETLMRLPTGGAIAYVGCDTGAQPCAVTLLEGFTTSLAARRDEPIGDAWRDALATYWKQERLAELQPDAGWYPPSIFFQGMKFLLFGDPTLRLWPAPDPAPPATSSDR
jgi:peptidase C25-like protein